MGDETIERPVPGAMSRRRILGTGVALGVPMAIAAGWNTPAGASEVTDAMDAHSGAVSAREHGFLPDDDPASDPDDNRLALQAAVDAAIAAQRTLYIPPGDYTIAFTSTDSSTVVDGQLEVVGGRGRTLIKAGPNVPSFAYQVFRVVGGSSLTARRLTVQGPADPGPDRELNAQTNAFYAENFDAQDYGGMTLDQVNVTGEFATAVNVVNGEGSFDLTVLGCDLTAAWQVLTYFSGPTTVRRFRAIASQFHDAGYPADGEIEPNGHLVYLHPHIAVYVEQCSFTGAVPGRWAWHQFGTGDIEPDYLYFVNCLFLGQGRVYGSRKGRSIFRGCMFIGPRADVYLYHGGDMIGCHFANEGGVATVGGIGDRVIRLEGCSFDYVDGDSAVNVGGAPGLTQVRDCTFTGNANVWVQAGDAGSRVEVTDCTFELPSDANGGGVSTDTGSHRYTRVRVTGQAKHDYGFLYASAGNANPVVIEDCDFSEMTSGPAIFLNDTGTANVRAARNTYSDPTAGGDIGRPAAAEGATMQARPRAGLHPTALASAAELQIGWNADTYRVTGTTTISTVTQSGRIQQIRAMAGTVRLIADGAWTLAHGSTDPGGIRTSTGADRAVQVGSVVSLTYDPSTLTWYEGA